MNNNNNNLLLNDYCSICKYLLQIIEHFPSNKQHYIWNNLGLITIDDNDNNIKDKIIIISLYKMYLDSVSYFIDKTQQLKNKNKIEQYYQYKCKLKERTQYICKDLIIFNWNNLFLANY